MTYEGLHWTKFETCQMKNENSPKKEFFCHYLKNFVTKLQLKMKTVLLETKNQTQGLYHVEYWCQM